MNAFFDFYLIRQKSSVKCKRIGGNGENHDRGDISSSSIELIITCNWIANSPLLTYGGKSYQGNNF